MSLQSSPSEPRSASPAAALYPPTIAPPASPLPLWQFLPRFVRNPLLTLPQAVYEEPFVALERGGRGMIWVTDPGIVERILLHEHQSFAKSPVEARLFGPVIGQGILTSEGQTWRWQRRTAAPLFRHQELVAHVPVMSDVAHEVLARWRLAPPGNVQRVDRDMTDAAYAVITRTMLAGTTPGEDRAVKASSHRLLSWTSWEVAFALMGIPETVWHPGKWPSRLAARKLRATVGSLLARRRAEPAGKSDLLARLVAARDPETGNAMSDDLLVDNLLTFLLAGHETTAKALTWTLYLLARAPDWQERVRTEVASVCGTQRVAARHLDSLTITMRVLRESMRLYPPVPVMTRVASREIEIHGWRLRPGTLIVIPVFAVHRHKRLWSDPDRFDPERFAPDAEVGHLRTQFMPFGFGPRTCIGMAFAMLEATTILATLVRGARFDWDGRHLPAPVSRVTLQPSSGMPLAVTPLAA